MRWAIARATAFGASLALSGCAPYARPLEFPWRASVAAFYTEAPRADAEPSVRAELAIDRWVDDRVLVGVDVAAVNFDRARGRTTSVTSAGARLAYVLDLGEIQPRFGLRASAERWLPSEADRAFTPVFATGFGALDWAPRAWPVVVGAEVQSPALAGTTTTAGTPGFAYGVRTAYAF